MEACDFSTDIIPLDGGNDHRFGVRCVWENVRGERRKIKNDSSEELSLEEEVIKL